MKPAGAALSWTGRNALESGLLHQLPRDLQSKFSVSVKTDAHMLRATAVFTEIETKLAWETPLLQGECLGFHIPCELPGEFLAQLCVVAK